MKFFGLKSCDACAKALSALKAAGHSPDVRDVRADGVAEADLRDWLAQAGPAVLVNRRSSTWRALGEGEKSGAESAEGALALLRAHPTLMKRPVIVVGDEIHVGWTPDIRAALL